MPSFDPQLRPFTVLVKTIAGRRYEITELHRRDAVMVLKLLLKNTLDPSPSIRHMRLVFGETVLDDDICLSEYNICEGSELDLILVSPPRSRGSRSRSRSRSRSASRSDTSSSLRSELLDLRPTMVIREV